MTKTSPRSRIRYSFRGVSAVQEPQDKPELRYALLAACILLLVYSLTLAPGLTLWDSGEFLSAVATLGVPHPPGTPLFVFVGKAWSETLGLFPLAFAMNLLSAVATAVGCAILAWRFLGWSGKWSVVAGGVVAGTMSAVWYNATETEVYAVAFALMAVYLAVADVAGARDSARHRLLVCFLFGLAVPLQVSALVAGPAAVMMLSTGSDGKWSWEKALVPGAAWVVAAGIGLASLTVAAAGAAVLVAAIISDRPTRGARWEAFASVLLVALGASFLVTMLIRAQFDPSLNAGNPSAWSALWDVVARAQYDVPGVWPRRAPFWLQIGNVIQYSDWQVAAGLSDAPGASLFRTPFTFLAFAIAAYGAEWHKRLNQRSFWALVVLVLSASLGVVVMLNLRAGPSYGWGVLPDGALREARERDYFFALAFAVWGLWCGLGVVRLANRLTRTRWRFALLSLALLPAILNWRANDRRQRPEAVLAGALGTALLRSAPPRAVLVTAGDNDSYSTWFAQYARGLRNDVTTVVAPMLGAQWYREELRRRHGLLDSSLVSDWAGEPGTLGAIASAASDSGRPLVVSVSLEKDLRLSMGPAWTLSGLLYIARAPGSERFAKVDTIAAREIADWLGSRGLGPRTAEPRGSTAKYVQRLLLCPSAAVRDDSSYAQRLAPLLESVCNY